jgi:hypothetical protein
MEVSNNGVELTVWEVIHNNLDKRLIAIEKRLAKKPRSRRRPVVSFDLDASYYDELNTMVAKCDLNSRSDLMRLIVKEWFYSHKDDQSLDIIASDVNEIDFR